MKDTAEGVCVDSGLILMVDPCYIFTDKQWAAICQEAHARGDEGHHFHAVILEKLKLKKKGEDVATAVVVSTKFGDGRYEVVRESGGIKIKGA